MPRTLAALIALAGALPAFAVDAALEAKSVQILTTNCAKCHGPTGDKDGGIDYISVPAKLVENKMVVPGQPDKSRIVVNISRKRMPPPPPDHDGPYPTPGDLDTLKAWITSMAPGSATPPPNGTAPPPVTPPPEPAAEVKRPFITPADNVAAMVKHLQRINPKHQKYQRYFTLSHLHNDPNVKAAELRLYQGALSKVLNSLSWKAGIVLPNPIDEHQTVFAVDIRKLDWDKHDLWRVVSRAYPYGMCYNNATEPPELAGYATQLYQMAETSIPAVRADWFVVTASRPPLYHDLLRLPIHAGQLERLLGVDVASNFERDELARAGFASSGVSAQNRMIERHESRYGAYWKSYDFKSNVGNGSLFSHPLGPIFPRNTYLNQAFKHDGGEIIFNLPNGLQAYMLVKGDDSRIDEGPTEVVRDKNLTTGQVQIINGLSCMFCHNQGMIYSDKLDQVRRGTGVGGDARQKVMDLYKTKEEIRALMDKDRDRFLAALELATGRYVRGPGEEAKTMQELPEVVGPLAVSYLKRRVNLKMAALECGIEDPALLKGAITSNPQLRGPLFTLAQGGEVGRDVWESVAGLYSLMQVSSQVLDMGTPARVR